MSEILDEGLNIFRLGFGRFILFQLILYIPSTIALASIFNRAGDTVIEMLRTGTVPPIGDVLLDAFIALAALFLIQTVVAAVSSVALTRGVADTYLSRTWTLASILKEAVRLAPRAALTGILIGLLVGGCLGVPISALGILALIFGPSLYASAGLIGVVMLGSIALVFALAACAAAVYAFLRYSLASTALAIEDLSVSDSLHRSVELMKGRYLPALGLFLVVVMLSALLGGVLSAFVPSPSFEGKDVDEIRRLLPDLIRAQIVSVILGQGVGVLTHTYSLVCWTLFYFSTRCEKEGFDLAFLAGKVGGT